MKRYPALLLLLLALLDAPALWACSLAPSGWMAYSAQNAQTEVPLEGVVILNASLNNYGILGLTPEKAMEFVTVQLTEADGEALTGTLEYEQEVVRSLIWRASTPLAPDSTYVLTATLDNEALAAAFPEGPYYERTLTLEWTLETASTATPAPTTPTLLTSSLSDRAVSTGRVCCSLPAENCFDSCGPGTGLCESCWDAGYVYLPELEAELDTRTPANLAPYTYYTLYQGTDTSADTLASTYGAGSYEPLYASLGFETEAGDYCLRFVKHTLLDDRTAESELICLTHDALVPDSSREPDYSALASCETLPEGYDRNGPIDESVASEGCGCSVSRAPSFPSGPAAAGLLLGGLVFGMRRRRARP